MRRPWMIVSAVVLAISAATWAVRDVLSHPAERIAGSFPHAMLIITSDGKQEPYVVRGAAPAGPRLVDDRWAWPAYTCTNERCPGRSDGEQLVFPFGTAEAAALVAKQEGVTVPSVVGSTSCPACAAALAAAAPDERQHYDPTQIEPWNTPEGRVLIERMKAALR